MPSFTATTLFVITFVLVLFPTETAAFGAGNIPDFSYLNGKAFRHGDIEDILIELIKSVGHTSGGGGLLGFASSVLGAASGGTKFTRDDVKRVYFGNWLRDYSQAMDIAGLSKLSADTLVLIVSILGFLTFGFATEEFEVTASRLGVYLPVEHIDNPKGYAAKEGDARRFHPQLRPPVDRRELEIDETTGMKNYMASEHGGWDTSTAFIRRTFRACIDHGRRSRGRDGADLWEAFRLLGQGLHTLEDFTAHSNWCEVALRKLGHREVFCHVGDNVLIDSPNGRCPPIVTGTFGGADFLHSLMGEATDHISQSSVTDLSEKMKNANQGNSSNMDALKGILRTMKGSGNDDHGAQINEAEAMEAKSKAYRFDPNNVFPPDVQAQLFAILKWRDSVYRDILKKMEMIPGLTDLMENLSNALNAYVYTVIGPYVTPILSQVTTVLGEGSKEVIDSEDQFEVFNDPNASDPTHSLLSKDHFQIILNECAGKVAQVVIRTTVNHIVQAWSNNDDADRVIDQILEAFHHPYYASGRSQVQNAMFDTMDRWIGDLGQSEAREVIQALTKESVRAGKNKRKGSEDETSNQNQGYSGNSQSYGQGQSSEDSYGSGGYSGRGFSGGGNEPSHGSTRQESGYNRTSKTTRREEDRSSYGSSGYGRQESQNEYPGYGDSTDSGYGRSNEASRGGRNDDSEYGGRGTYGRDDEPSYGRSSAYGRDSERPSYGGHGQEETPSYAPSYAPPRSQRDSGDGESAYGSRRDEESPYAPSYRQTGGQEYGRSQGTSGYAPSYSQSTSEDYPSQQYPSRQQRSGDDSYSQQYNTTGYGHSSEHAHGGQEKHRHHRGREDNEYGSGETFGAERLNLGEDEEGESRHNRHGQHGNRY